MKYEITDETIDVYGVKLRRIKALIDFADVNAGDMGGFIETENNLSQSGEAWVYGEAQVYGKAQVYGEARVSGEAQVYGEARVSGEAQVYGEARVFGEARVYGEAQVYGKAQVYGEAQVYGKAQVYGEARVFGEARVSGEAWVYGKAQVNFDTTETKWIVVGQFGEYRRYVTVTKTGAIFCGCFEGGIEEFEKAISEKYGSDFGSYADCLTIIKNYIAQ